MANDSPAVIVFDINGNPIGSISDGIFYRLQTDTRITDGISYVGITDVAGHKALKVDVVKTISSGGVGTGGTSSNFADQYPIAGTAIGYSDGYYMQNARVFDLDTSINSEFIIGTNLRTYGLGGSVEFGTNTNPIRIDPTGNTIQPISGTITANQGTSPWITINTLADGYLSSILANQTNGTQHTIIDGYVQTNPNVITTGHVSIDGYVQTNPNINVSGRVSVALADTPQLDAFGRLRVSQPQTIFDSKLTVDASPLFWDDQQTSGSGTSSTYNSNNAYVQMSVGNTTAGTRVRQTFRHFNYQPGKGHFIIMTGVLGAGATGITRKLGYFDGYNGVYFDLAGTTLGVTIRSSTSGSVVNTKVNQSAWNLDKLDGTGLSGYTIDPSKDNIFIIDFQWLGAGRVRFGFDIDGVTVYCHQVLNANKNTTSYMASPNLPLRYEISNDGTGPAASLIHICSAVNVEGGVENTGLLLSLDRGVTPLTTLNNTSIYPLIAIRLKSTALSAIIEPQSLQVMCNTTSAYRFILLINPTVIGTAFTWTSLPNSAQIQLMQLRLLVVLELY
jgi:hypothetical protein